MKSNHLFEPTLTDENSYPRQSYDINKLFYVAFFGGIVPTIWLGTKNAKWFNIDKKKINLLIGIGILIFILNITLYLMITLEMISMNRTLVRIINKGTSLIMYLGYYKSMESDFRQHEYFGGNIQPIFKDAIVISLISVIIEIFIIGIITAMAGVI